ncbi:EpsG family protein [uncultured Polaribacter sp.]|uniref:EpsG family protein n=1 Tax=uncultured Polaribacter sp. TaxID=174711 RepID=UPI002636C0CC|nr:EpsG family protein [uncultured Polaribacter sp.]
MLVYIIFILLVFTLPLLGRIKLIEGVKIYGYTATFIVIFIFCALRFDVGYDYSMYYGLIEGGFKFFDNQINRIEFLSRQLILFSNFIGFYQFFFIVSSFVITYFFYKTIKENSFDKWLSTLIFVCFPIFFFVSLSVVRQYIVVAILFFSFRFIKKRKFWSYLIIVSLCGLIHKSSFFALPIYFLYGSFLNRKVIVLVYVLGFFSSEVLAFFIRILSEKYTDYLGQITGEGGNLMLIFFQFLGLSLLPFVYNFRDKNDKDFDFYLLTFYVGLFIWSSLSKFGHAGFRGGLYYMCFTILLIPHLKNKVKEYKIIRSTMAIVCFLFFFINLYIGSKHKIKDSNLPYQTFFYKSNKDFKPND